MNRLTFKRNYKYILILLIFVSTAVAFGNTRIISYNFGEYFTEIEIPENNIENSIDIFYDTLVHDIKLDLTTEDYENLILYYQQNNEKEYLQTDIIIDGVEIPNIGVRLKGNQVVLGDIKSINMQEINFSFMIRFDEYVEGQSYQKMNEIALISGSISELKGKYIAGEIYNLYDVVAPDISFAKLTTGGIVGGTYAIKEVVNEDFLEKYYSDVNGLLYKAENSLSFTYLGEDPTRYTDLFTQKTLVNNYDLKKLIEISEFVSESGNTKFRDEFTKYIDIENYTKYLAVNDILYGENDKISLLNSYYIYYNLETETVSFIPWDQEYIFNFETTSLYSVLEKVFSKQEMVDLSRRDIREILDNYTETDYTKLKTKYENDLEDTFLSEGGFGDFYETAQSELYNLLWKESFVAELEEKLNTLLLN
ncbi:CotH kinase family protein [Candidatus Gracilibacteria bacterium]|nr:CotH kinase family protein [Candidatus Gracilibacteria bacterium]